LFVFAKTQEGRVLLNDCSNYVNPDDIEHDLDKVWASIAD